MLSRNDSRNQSQETLQLVPRGQCLQAVGAAGEDGGEVGQTDGIAIGDLAQCAFAVGRRWRNGMVVGQGLPTSWRNHLRWCLKPQPRVTVPRVMALIVPFTQIAA